MSINVEGRFFLLKDEFAKSNCIKWIDETPIGGVNGLHCVQIKPFKKVRTTLQNNYLWGWIYKQIVDSFNDSGRLITLEDGTQIEWMADDIHELCKKRFLATKFKTKKGVLERYKSTKELSKKDFINYVEQIKFEAADKWGVVIREHDGGYWSSILGEAKK